MKSVSELLDSVTQGQDPEQFKELHWEGSFTEYVEMVLGNRRIVRNSYQRLYDMILSYGYEEFTEHKEKLVRYHFFSDPVENGRDAIYGLEKSLMRLVGNIKAAAAGAAPPSRAFCMSVA